MKETIAVFASSMLKLATPVYLGGKAPASNSCLNQKLKTGNKMDYFEVIHSRDIITRIAELESMRVNPAGNIELAFLLEIRDECGRFPNWGSTLYLVHGNYFKEYIDDIAGNFLHLSDTPSFVTVEVDQHALRQEYMGLGLSDGQSFYVHLGEMPKSDRIGEWWLP